MLDAFWEEKGYIRPEEYRRFCNSTVPLLRLPKLIYTNKETVKGSLEVAHFGAAPLEVTSTAWTLKTKEGKTIASGKLAHQPVGIGNCIPLGQLEIPLDKVVPLLDFLRPVRSKLATLHELGLGSRFA